MRGQQRNQTKLQWQMLLCRCLWNKNSLTVDFSFLTRASWSFISSTDMESIDLMLLYVKKWPPPPPPPPPKETFRSSLWFATMYCKVTNFRPALIFVLWKVLNLITYENFFSFWGPQISMWFITRPSNVWRLVRANQFQLFFNSSQKYENG